MFNIGLEKFFINFLDSIFINPAKQIISTLIFFNSLIDLTSKLDLSLINVNEINNINELGNNISNLTISRYTNHTNLVKDCTLLYIDARIRPNEGNIYPDLNSYNYNGINLSNILLLVLFRLN